MNKNLNANTDKRKELIEGVKGNGQTKYMVVTVEVATGRWLWSEEFDTRAEAESWKKWA